MFGREPCLVFWIDLLLISGLFVWVMIAWLLCLIISGLLGVRCGFMCLVVTTF